MYARVFVRIEFITFEAALEVVSCLAEACFELLQFSSDERKGRVEFGNIMQARARLTQ